MRSRNLIQDLFKDQRGSKPTDPAPLNTTGEMLTMHSDAGVNIIPWGYSHSSPDAQ